METDERRAFEWAREQERARQRLVRSDRIDAKQFAEELVGAAAELASASVRERTSDDRAVQKLGAPPGDTEGPLEGYLSARTRIDARLRLRMAYVPTAYVHVLEPETEPLLTVEVHNTGKDTVRIRVRSFVEGYSAAAVDLIEVPPGGEHSVDQLPTFFPLSLEPVREATRATLHVEVEQLDAREPGLRIEEHRTFRLWLLPRTTAVLHQSDPSTGDALDRTRFLSCWVTPNAPAVMHCLREAADRTPDGGLSGHAHDPASVLSQVKAVYETIAARGIEYVNSVTALCASGTFAQRVRLPRESLETRSANCIDRTVLFASLLEAASLRPAVVTLPGHALLAWNDGARAWAYLETTMSGRQPFEIACETATETIRTLHARGVAHTCHDIARLRSQGMVPLE